MRLSLHKKSSLDFGAFYLAMTSGDVFQIEDSLELASNEIDSSLRSGYGTLQAQAADQGDNNGIIVIQDATFNRYEVTYITDVVPVTATVHTVKATKVFINNWYSHDDKGSSRYHENIADLALSLSKDSSR